MKNNTHKALIIPSADWGNMGDMAMMTGALHALRLLGFSQVDAALSHPQTQYWVEFDNFVDGGNWFYNGDQANRDRLLDRLNIYSHVYLIGADCIDGSYNPESIIRRIELVAEAVNRGLCGRILGASFNQIYKERCAEVLRAFPPKGCIAARDPISRRRMETVLGRAILQTADLAFLCPSDAEHAVSKPVLEWITGQRDLARRVVALSINAAICRADNDFARAHTPTIEQLIANDVSVVLVPHDTRRDKTDEFFLRSAVSGLSEDLKIFVTFLPAVNASATKAVLGAVDLLISSRMHPVILAAGGGCATLSYAYQGKFEGLYRMIGLDHDDLVFYPTDLTTNPLRMATATRDALAKSRSLSQKIHDRLPEIIDLAMANFV